MNFYVENIANYRLIIAKIHLGCPVNKQKKKLKTIIPFR